MEDLKSLTVGQVLERGAAQVPDKTAVVDGNLRKTFDELKNSAKAAWLKWPDKTGIGIEFTNSPEG